MKQMKLNTKIIFSIIAVATMAIVGFYVLTSQPASKNKTALTDYIEGFEENTLVTLTSLSKENITEDEIKTPGTEKTPLSFSREKAPKNFILNIKNKSQNFDITARQTTENTILKFEGLPLDTKISVLSDKKQIHQNVPVDWAGNLTLTQSHKPASLCAIINNKEKICYSTNNKGRSS